MTVFNGYVSPTLGMMAQAHALNTIGINLANVNTGGFKSTETRFSTVLSDTLDKHKVPYDEINIAGAQEREYRKELLEKAGDQGVPQVFVDGKHIGDDDTIEEWAASGKLAELAS